MSKPATKAEVKRWMRRVREDLRNMQAALDNDDWTWVIAMAQDASGAACEIETVASVADGSEDVTGSYHRRTA